MQEKILGCYRAFSKVDNLYDLGSTGGVATTLALAALEKSIVDGFVTLDRTIGCWQLARDLKDLKRACGSAYNFTLKPKGFTSNRLDRNYGMIGKPCDLSSKFSPLISIFCSRVWTVPVTKENIKTHRQHSSILKMPLKCSRFFCRDHVGKKADISVGDTQTDRKVNVVIVRTDLGQSLFDLALKLKYISATKIPFNIIKEKQPYLWR